MQLQYVPNWCAVMRCFITSLSLNHATTTQQLLRWLTVA